MVSNRRRNFKIQKIKNVDTDVLETVECKRLQSSPPVYAEKHSAQEDMEVCTPEKEKMRMYK